MPSPFAPLSELERIEFDRLQIENAKLLKQSQSWFMRVMFPIITALVGGVAGAIVTYYCTCN